MENTIESYLTDALSALMLGKTKSEIEVLTAVVKRDTIKPKRLKRHDKAIANLKARGVLIKGKDSILKLAK